MSYLIFNYPPLKDPCKTMIETERCLGCNRLELESWDGSQCEWALEQIKEPEQLRIEEEK